MKEIIMSDNQNIKDDLIREGLKLRQTFSFDYWIKLNKNDGLLTPEDYLNELLPQNNEMFALAGGHLLEDKYTASVFIQENQKTISVMVNKTKAKRQVFNLDVLFSYMPSDDVIYTIEQMRASSSSFKYLPFFMYLPNDLKRNQRFWIDLQKEESYILAQNACYEIQDSVEMRKVVEKQLFGMSLEKYLQNEKNKNLSFVDLAIQEKGNFMVLPKEYKEDISFVKEVMHAHAKIKADKGHEKLWLMLKSDLQKNREIINLEFAPQKNKEYESLGSILKESNNIRVFEDDELFFDILKIAYSEPVKTSNRKNIFYFCFNKTFHGFFKDLVSTDIDLTNISNHEIIELILNKKLEKEMRKDCGIESESLISKKTLKF